MVGCVRGGYAYICMGTSVLPIGGLCVLGVGGVLLVFLSLVYGQVFVNESVVVVDLGGGFAECGVNFGGWIGCISLRVTFRPELVGGFDQPS